MNRRTTAAVQALAAAAVFLAVAVSAAGGAPQAPERVTVANPVSAQSRVQPALVRELARRGRVDAVITTASVNDLGAIRRMGIRGTALRTMPIFLAHGLTSAQLAKLRRASFVQGVWPNRRYRVDMEDTTWITRARYAWEANNRDNGLPPLGQHGYTGAGIHVAVIDTGADGKHADMDNLVEFCETQQAVSGQRNTVLCSPFLPASGNAGPAGPTNNPRLDSTDDDGHGSHVSGTIAGTGDASGGRANPHSTIGMAPDAKLHVYSANIGPALLDHEILAAYDDMTYKREAGIYPTVAVNNSWGGGAGSTYDPGDPQHIAIKRAYFAGILSVFSAGNSGSEHNTLGQQCISPFVICVAATTKPDSVVMFSSRGRPSQPQDTNRNGQITEGAGDVPPDNHDPKLGRAFDVGRYRPSVSAPGTNINSINGDMTSCREPFTGTPEEAAAAGCYVRFNGTSMSAPHVTGLAALVAEAYHKGHQNRLPSAQIIADIVERSSNWFSKLPGWEAEEQGTGRIDAYSAVEFAKEYPNGMKEPVLGTATPRYAISPEVTAQNPEFKGCTGTLSWTLPEADPFPSSGEEPSPIAVQRYGQHFIVVPNNVDRLRITVRWPRHPGTNLYLRLWRPGEGRGDPSTAEAPVGNQLRFMADQEGVGLTDTAAVQNTRRFVDVRAPEPTTGTPPPRAGIGQTVDVPPGLWTLRVFHRAGGSPATCDADSQENPKQAEGFNYTVKVEMPTSKFAPTARITEPADGAVITDRWQQLGSKAELPASWEGVTNWEVPGTEIPGSIPEPDERKILYFHGNNHVADPSAPDEAACDGSPGNDDVLSSRCPMLLESSTLSPDTAAVFSVPTTLLNGAPPDRNAIDPNWTWYVSTTTQIGGAMTVEWWASCGMCGAVTGDTAAWNIRLYADGNLKFQRRVTAVPQFPEVPDRLEATVFLPQIIANNRITLQIDPVFVNTQFDTRIYYDSEQECLPDPTAQGPRCDSLVRMPVDLTGVSGTGPGPVNLRATDRHKFIRLAWQETSGAAKYEIHRDLEPAFVPSPRTRIAITTGFPCTSPENPTWTTENRPGRCYDDAGNHLERTYYYRVVAVQANGTRSLPSRVAYNMRTQYDRQVKVKVDRLYGPVFWEHSSLFSDPENSWHHWWDTLELNPGPHHVFTRSFSQGIGSPKDRRTYNDSGDDS